MAKIVGYVKSAEGTFYVKGIDGSIRKLKSGDPVFEYDYIYNPSKDLSQKLVIDMKTGDDELVFSGKVEIIIDDSVVGTEALIADSSLREADAKSVLTDVGTAADESDPIDELLKEFGDLDVDETALGEADVLPDSHGDGDRFATESGNSANAKSSLLNPPSHSYTLSGEWDPFAGVDRGIAAIFTAMPVQTTIVQVTAPVAPQPPLNQPPLPVAPPPVVPQNSVDFKDANGDGYVNSAESGNLAIVAQVDPGSSIERVFITDGIDIVEIPMSEIEYDPATGKLRIEGVDISSLKDGDIKVVMDTVSPEEESIRYEDTIVKDTVAPQLSVDLEPISGDGVINSLESQSDVQINGKVSGEFSPGDKVVVAVNGKEFAGEIEEDGSFFIDVPGSELAADPDGKIEVFVTGTDQAGNVTVTEEKSDFFVDTAAPFVSIGSISEDSGTAGDFITSDTTLVVYGSADAGSIVDIYVDDIKVGSVTADTNGEWSYDYTSTPLSEGVHTLKAVATDSAGNSATAIQNVTIDTTSPSIVLDEISDNYINALEKGGDLSISGKTTGAEPGSVVAVAFAGKEYSTTVEADGSFSVTVPSTDLEALAEGMVYTATATVTDSAGNSATDTEDVTVDTTPPVISVNAPDTTSDTTPTISGYTDAPAGGEVTIEVTDSSGVTQSFTATINPDGSYSADVPSPLGEGSYSVTATVSDEAGNTSSATDPDNAVDTAAPQPPEVIIAEDVNNDGYINATELDGEIDVKVILPKDASAGDLLVVTDNHNNSFEKSLADQDIASGYVMVSFTDPGDGNLISVSATLTDAAGNTSLSSSDTAVIDTTAPSASITIDADITADDIINASEAVQNIEITGKVGGDVKAGDNVSLTVNGKLFTGTVTTAGTFVIAVSGADLAADSDKTIEASVTTFDAAGNSATAYDKESYSVDTLKPTISDQSFLYAENRSSGEVVATVNAKDDVAIEGFWFKHSDGTLSDISEDGFYQIDSGGRISLTAVGAASVVNDYEQSPNSGSYEVSVSDTAGNISSATVTLGEENLNDNAPRVDTVTVHVSEEGLAGGNTDTIGVNPGDDTTDTASASGLIAGDADGDKLTVSLTAPSQTVYSGGKQVVWGGEGSSSLTGSVDGKDVVVVSVNEDGGYDVKLLAPIDHPQNSVEDTISFDIGVTVSDGTYTDSGRLTVVVEDDSPLVTDATDTVKLAGQDTNVQLILDISGSMGYPADPNDPNSPTRLDMMKDAVNSMLAKYETLGNVRVNIVVFGSEGEPLNTGWIESADAKSIVNSLVAEGGTNYDEGLLAAMESFDSSGSIVGAANISYFMTDGNPTYYQDWYNRVSESQQGTTGSTTDEYDGIQSSEEIAWINFLQSNDVVSHAFVLGDGATTQNVDPIAYDGAGSTDMNGVVVSDLNDLENILRDTVVPPSSGTLTGSVDAGFGADGQGSLYSLTIDGVTYVYDAETNTVSSSGGVDRGVYDSLTNHLTVETDLGGKLVVNMVTGEYSYTASAEQTGVSEQIDYKIVDADGDISDSGRLTLQIVAPDIDPNPQIYIDNSASDIDIVDNIYNESVVTDSGDDWIKNSYIANSSVDMKEGDDLVGTKIIDNSSLLTGADDDRIYLLGSDTGRSDWYDLRGSDVDTGDGNDIFYFDFDLNLSSSYVKDSTINLGNGKDTLVFTQNDLSDFTFTNTADGLLISSKTNTDVSFTVTNVEYIYSSKSDETYDVSTSNINRGIVIDGIVEGLYYETSSGMSGYTDSTGGFDYLDGDSVTFKIGDLTVGTITAQEIEDGKVFLQDIADTQRSDLEDPYVENMAILLQSLDSDSYADNGIVITEQMHEAFNGIELDLSDMDRDELLGLLDSVGVDAVTESSAMDHVERMLDSYDVLEDEEPEADAVLAAVADDSIDLEAIVQEESEAGDVSTENIYDSVQIALEDVLQVEDESVAISESEGSEDMDAAISEENTVSGDIDPTVVLKIDQDNLHS